MSDDDVIERELSANAHPTARIIWEEVADCQGFYCDCGRMTRNRVVLEKGRLEFTLSCESDFLKITVCDHIRGDQHTNYEDTCIECMIDDLDEFTTLLEHRLHLPHAWMWRDTPPCAVRQRAERALARRRQSRAYRSWLPGARRVALAGSLSRGSHRARVVGRGLGARIASFL
jgi:hypothetical protein